MEDCSRTGHGPHGVSAGDEEEEGGVSGDKQLRGFDIKVKFNIISDYDYVLGLTAGLIISPCELNETI